MAPFQEEDKSHHLGPMTIGKGKIIWSLNGVMKIRQIMFG